MHKKVQNIRQTKEYQTSRGVEKAKTKKMIFGDAKWRYSDEIEKRVKQVHEK
jgi:hypothetical protein